MLKLLRLILEFFAQFGRYLADKQLLDAGAAKQREIAHQEAENVEKQGEIARSDAAVRDADPGRLRDNDGFRRD